jgi:hypothetical protein
LLFAQFAPAMVLDQYFRIIPKVVKKLAGELVDAERFQPIRVRRFS